MININDLKFDAQGLIPAIVVDFYTREVLTLAYMNRESLEISMKEGTTCFMEISRLSRFIYARVSTSRV